MQTIIHIHTHYIHIGDFFSCDNKGVIHILKTQIKHIFTDSKTALPVLDDDQKPISYMNHICYTPDELLKQSISYILYRVSIAPIWCTMGYVFAAWGHSDVAALVIIFILLLSAKRRLNQWWVRLTGSQWPVFKGNSEEGRMLWLKGVCEVTDYDIDWYWFKETKWNGSNIDM